MDCNEIERLKGFLHDSISKIKIDFLGQQQTRLSAPVITGKGHLNPDEIFVTVLYWLRYLGDY